MLIGCITNYNWKKKMNFWPWCGRGPFPTTKIQLIFLGFLNRISMINQDLAVALCNWKTWIKKPASEYKKKDDDFNARKFCMYQPSRPTTVCSFTPFSLSAWSPSQQLSPLQLRFHCHPSCTSLTFQNEILLIRKPKIQLTWSKGNHSFKPAKRKP